MLKPRSHGTLLTGITTAMAEVLKSWQVHHHMYQKHIRAFCVVFHDMMPSCRIWSVPHANKQQETNNAAGSLAASLFMTRIQTVNCHFTLCDVNHPGLAAVKVDMFWQLTSPDLREGERAPRSLLLKRILSYQSF